MRRFFLIILTLAVTALPLKASPDNTYEDQNKTIGELSILLEEDYRQREEAAQQFLEEYGQAHREITRIINKNDDLSMLLLGLDPVYTFSMSWTLKEIAQEYENFKQARKDFYHYYDDVTVDIDRYGRLIESLQKRAVSPDLEASRDSCIAFAEGILSSQRFLLDSLESDRQELLEAERRLNETNEYVEARFTQLEQYIFKDGQSSWAYILSDFRQYRELVRYDLSRLYNIDDMNDRIYVHTQKSSKDWSRNRGENTILLVGAIIKALELLLFCVLGALIVMLGFRLFKKRHVLNGAQKSILGMLLGCIVLLGLHYITYHPADIFIQAMLRMFEFFMWEMIIILTALLIRVEPKQLKASLSLYLSPISLALAIIICRISFMPDRLMTLLLTPILLLVCIRQLIICLRLKYKASRIDRIISWVFLGVATVALVVALMGYTFASMLILTWWFVQLAFLLAILAISHLVRYYRDKRVAPRLERYQARMEKIDGLDKRMLLFGSSWFYELMSRTVLPVLTLISIPFCLQMTMDIFDFDKVFHLVYLEPFIHLTDKDGADVLVISFQILILLLSLFFVFRYLDLIFHALWQNSRYASFRRKNRRMIVRTNEMNLSLGNSIISVVVWLIYIATAVYMLRIPLGSLGLVLGGLSAGIGLAMKDLINNFIYGILLMSGRMRVGDYIECDGIRGKVSFINYQYTQLDTFDGNSIIFTNSTLFNKNFKNLTRGNAYEVLKIPVTVGYGEDVDRIRTLLLDALQPLRTKDRFGRDIVNPESGISMTVSEFEDRGIELTIKQFVLVEERNGYRARAAELIYDTLCKNGVDIPFPQIDVHLSK